MIMAKVKSGGQGEDEKNGCTFWEQIEPRQCRLRYRIYTEEQMEVEHYFSPLFLPDFYSALGSFTNYVM